MNASSAIYFFAVASLLTACGTTGQTANQPRKVLPEEISSFKRLLDSRGQLMLQKPESLYTQPVNQTVPCKLPTSKEQLDRRNFRAYWDGQCRDGYAYGLGRDIALSDTHHLEEIAIYGMGGEIVNAPAVTYDFVNNEVHYRYHGTRFPAETIFSEKISNDQRGFAISYSLGRADVNGNSQMIFWSPFNDRRVFVSATKGIVYRYTEGGATKAGDPIFIFEAKDDQSIKQEGFAIVRYRNNEIRHFKTGSGQPEPVQLPPEFRSEAETKYREVVNAQVDMSAQIELTKRMEREYLFMACSGKHEIAGLDSRISTKICTWRDQFQEQFKDAQKHYLDRLERDKLEARNHEEQRRAQEQLDNQRRLVQAAERQAGAAENANLQQQLNVNRIRTCYTNFGLTTCY